MSRFYIFLFSGIVLFGSLGVAVLKVIGVLDYPFYIRFLPSSIVYTLGVVYCTVFLASLIVLRRVFGLHMGLASGGKTSITLPDKLAAQLIVGACAYALLYTWIEFDLLTAKVSFRHSGNELFQRISLIIMLTGIFAASTRPTPIRMAPLALLLFSATLAPSADAGRTVAIPFLVAAATMMYNGYRVIGGVTGATGAVALAAAFESRNLPSYDNFWATVGEIINSFDVLRIIKPIIGNSFPGLDTMSITLVKAAQSYDISFYRYLEFIAYYSPAPSFLFPNHFFDQTSLNALIGISPDIVGINSDLYSESLFWFGYPGVFITPFLLALMICASFYSARVIFSGISQRSQLVASIPVIWMLVGGMVFSLRAGSRFVWIIVIAALVVKAARVLYGGNSPFNRHEGSA